MNTFRGVAIAAVGSLSLLFAGVPSAWAGYGPADSGNLGVGFVAGGPTGVTAKYWLNPKIAVDGDIGWMFDDGVTLVADYLWHDYSAFSLPKSSGIDGKLGLFLGPGMRIQTDGDDNFGLRGVMGLS